MTAFQARTAFAQSDLTKNIETRPWGSLERIADRVWAVVSTPLDGNTTTFSNGGLIAGDKEVLAIEGFATPAGAAWLCDAAKQLTGRRPTYVVLTHFHGDHSTGLPAYQYGNEPLRIVSTPATRKLLLDRELAAPLRDTMRKVLLPDMMVIESAAPLRLDLGGRTVTIHSRSGHTPSDLTVEIQEPNVIWGGDLLWNGIFPNYVDAIPTRLAQSVREVLKTPQTICVPGHGGIARASGFADYVNLIDYVGEFARRTLTAGTPAAKAAEGFRLPESLQKWALLSKNYPTVALTAWEREMAGK
jgi:glyoxylase-like metal-dependent hydrolase (beta-lactamase superfamily II)